MHDLGGMDHAHWMRRCLQLAANGAGLAAPNPMVGAVLVQGDGVLAEGWHRAHGAPHAEVECLRAFGDGPVPQDAVLYVSLEPCAHTGLTPPCADLLIARGVRTVVVACTDPDPRVSGRGLAKLREAGIAVITDVLRDEARWLNRRFITAAERQRPHVILKWAQSADAFLDRHPVRKGQAPRISCFTTDVRVHRWRSEEQAIMAGSRTVLNDDPLLNVRLVAGRSPLRVVLDRSGITPASSRVYHAGPPTLLFTAAMRDLPHAEQVLLRDGTDPLHTVLGELHERKVRSVLVEGGAELLGHFLAADLWDEARVIIGDILLGSGTPAPRLALLPAKSVTSGSDRIHFYLLTGTAPEGRPR